MTPRQKQILNLIIQEYRSQMLPVSSFLISQKYHFKLSPATVRNEMVFLEKAGFIQNLHTSSGRIPTDKGFRFFVNILMKEEELSVPEKQKLKNKFLQVRRKRENMAQALSELLADLSGNLAVINMENDLAERGFSLLLQEPEFENREEVLKIAKFLDSLKDWLDEFSVNTDVDRVSIYIGQEMPQIKDLNISMLISKIFSAEEGTMILIGPKRMHYERNISLLQYIKKLLSF